MKRSTLNRVRTAAEAAGWKPHIGLDGEILRWIDPCAERGVLLLLDCQGRAYAGFYRFRLADGWTQVLGQDLAGKLISFIESDLTRK